MAATIRILVEVSGGLGAVKKDIEDVGESARKSGGGFNALQEIAVGALREIGAAAINLAGAGLQKLAGLIGDSIGLAGNFEAGMNAFGAAAGKGFEPGTEALGEFKDLFISLGKELPVSTSEVQAAATALIKGGLSPAVVEAGALRDSLNFAAAAGMGLAEAAELTIKQLGTFVPIGASVEEQTRFMADAQNLLVKAAGASTLNVDELGNAMLAAGGQARAAGLDYEEFVTTMGLISPSFGSAAEAGTSFKNFLSRMNPSTKAAKESMADLGLMTTSTGKLMAFLSEHGIQPLGTDLDTLGNQFTEFAAAQGFTVKETTKVWESFGQSKFFDDATGKFVGMEKASELLKTAMAGLSDQQRIQYLQTIFGNDAMGAATALAGAGAEGFQAFAEKMLAANGVAGQAEATQQGFNFQLENMKGSLEALQITIGTALLPVLASLIGDYITPGINALMGYAEAFMPVIAAIQETGLMSSEFGESLGYFATQIGLPGEAIQAIVFAFQGLVATIQDAGLMSSEFGEALGYLATQFGLPGETVQNLTFKLQSFIAFVSDNLTPILSGLAAMILAVVVPAFTAWAISAGAAALAMLPIIAPIVAIGVAVGLLVAAWMNNWGGIQEKTAAVWAVIQPIFAAVADWLSVMIPIAIQATVDFVTMTLIPAFQAIWDFIQTNIFPIFQMLWTWLSVTLPAGIQVLATFWTGTLLPAINAVWSFLNTYVIPLITALVNLHFAVLGLALRTLAGIWTTVLLPALTSVWTFIKDNLGPIINWLNVVILTPLFKILGDIFATIIGSILPVMAKLSSIVKDEVSKAFLNLNSYAGAAAGGLSKIGEAVSSVIKWISDLAAKLNSISIPDWLQGHSPPPMADWFSYIGEGIAGVNAQLPALAMNLNAQIGPSGQSISNTASTRSFTYAPTVYAAGGTDMPMDLALATSLAGV